MHAFPRYRPDLTRCLDGAWEFAFLGEVDEPETLDVSKIATPDRLAVPGVFDACPAWAGRRGVGVLRTFVEVTAGRSAQLRFDGLGLWCKLYVDGRPVGTHDLPYSGWSVMLPPSTESRRTIELVIDNRLDKKRTPLVEPYFDFYLYGGVYRPVLLRELVGPSIEQARITVLDRVAGRIHIVADAFEAVPSGTALSVRFDDGPVMEIADVNWNGRSVDFEMDVPNATAWTPDAPHLHVLTLRLGEDELVTRFGLRDFRVDGPRLLLNDQPIKLHGFCRHESHPQFGPALPHAQLIQDIQLLADMGCNFVRGSHYPQDPRFLDLCDEHGLLVFEESLGWQPQPEHFVADAFCDRVEAQTRRMIRSSYNHPSVVMWGFLNEGRTETPESAPLYERLVAAVRREDSTRPVTFASNHPFDDINLALPDIVSINMYPGWYSNPEAGPRPLEKIVPAIERVLDRMAELGVDDRPFIVSEIGAGAIYGWRDAHRAHWSEEYQADLLRLVCNKVIQDDRIAGVSLWQYCDGRTYDDGMAIKRPRGFNNKGVLDEYRRPKLAAEVVRAAFRGESIRIFEP